MRSRGSPRRSKTTWRPMPSHISRTALRSAWAHAAWIGASSLQARMHGGVIHLFSLLRARLVCICSDATSLRSCRSVLHACKMRAICPYPLRRPHNCKPRRAMKPPTIPRLDLHFLMSTILMMSTNASLDRSGPLSGTAGPCLRCTSERHTHVKEAPYAALLQDMLALTALASLLKRPTDSQTQVF